MHNKLAVLISSCDKFCDTWEACTDLLQKNFLLQDSNKYLLTNNKTPNFDGVDIVPVGPDKDWSSNLLMALNKINAKYVILWLDDAFLRRPVKENLLLELVKFADKVEAKYIRLRKNPTLSKIENGLCTQIFDEGRDTISVFPTLWNREFLMEFIVPGESAWEFEEMGSKRAIGMNGLYTCNRNVFSYLHGIERGVWIAHTANFLEGMGYMIAKDQRRSMTKMEVASYKFRCFKGFILNNVSIENRVRILLLADKAYRLLGMR